MADFAFWLANQLKIEAPLFAKTGPVLMKGQGVCVVKLTTPAAVQVTLPAHPKSGDFAIVKDGAGNSNGFPITVVPDGSTNATTIDGQASHVIDTNYGSAEYMHNGTEWSLLNYLGQNVQGLPIETSADSLTAKAGGGQASATLCAYGINRFSTVATIGNSAQLPVAAPGLSVTVINGATNSMQVFGNQSGTDTINGTAGATGIALAGGKTATFYSASTGTWHYTISS